MTASLPIGFRVELDPKVRHLDSGHVLVGGSPITAVRLAPAARARVVDGAVLVTDAVSSHLASRLLDTNLGHPVVTATHDAPADTLTVVVPVRDRAEQLDRCLAALAPLPVVVVDDASRDPASVAEVARRHGARLLPLEVNVGPACARNAGLAEVTTPLVAFVDSDVEVTAADLLRLTRHLADPSVALAAPKVAGRARSQRSRWFERYDAAASSLTLGDRPCNVRPGAAVAWLPSACLVGRVSLLGSGFDATMRVGEDVDLVWRLADAGHRVRYAPEVVAHHDVRGTVRGWLGRKFVYGSGGAALARRHGSRTAPAVLSPVMALSASAVLLRRRWSAPVVALGIVSATRSVHRALPDGLGTATRARVGAGMSVSGVGWAVRQESALLLRHWWPLAALGLPSSHARRALLTAIVVDTCVAVTERPADGPSLGVLLVGRRLDDLAYGTGLWWGAVLARSTAALRPRRPGAPKARIGPSST
ncbi:mycofactocin biosynthesis glycosyltransferase MftF [Nocardioides sediminis]|uniref:mycofactocin biosynthesis glycosyltransferase MftF n=1 Tax=Nocardioides sediminis TaxID=433648 RepID=UPI000D2FBCA0|nr:mycofactocin biosynthesis glycosyltransferase MftF [Nocardioides sediminis]